MENNAVIRELYGLEQKIDKVISVNGEIITKLALEQERTENSKEAIRRYGSRLDDYEKRIRDLEEEIRKNNGSRDKTQTWLERGLSAVLLAHFGWDKVG